MGSAGLLPVLLALLGRFFDVLLRGQVRRTGPNRLLVLVSPAEGELSIVPVVVVPGVTRLRPPVLLAFR